MIIKTNTKYSICCLDQIITTTLTTSKIKYTPIPNPNAWGMLSLLKKSIKIIKSLNITIDSKKGGKII